MAIYGGPPGERRFPDEPRDDDPYVPYYGGVPGDGYGQPAPDVTQPRYEREPYGPEDLYSESRSAPRAGQGGAAGLASAARREAAAAPRPASNGWARRRTTIIVAAAAALIIGAGSAAAATFLTGGDDPAKNAAGEPTGTPDGTPAAKEPPAAPPANAADTISMSATGDIVMGIAPGSLPPNNGKGFFDSVKSAMAADFQMVNLEQTITDDTGVGKCSAASAGRTCFAFRTPPATVQNLKDAGVTVANMANNHAYDFGPAGYKNTQTALDSVGIKYTGAPGVVTVVEAKGIKIALVGFASYAQWSNLCSDIEGTKRLVGDAAKQADLVVVQVHMGAEGADQTHTRDRTETFLGENRCNPVGFSHAAVDAGADLVVGHGPHVMRGMEFYKDRLIAYSLGNFAGYRSLGIDGVVGVGGVLKVTLRRDGGWQGGTLVPTYMVSPGLPRPDPKKQAIPLVGGLSKSDFPSTGAKIAADGAITQ